MRVFVRPAAVADIQEAADWYEEQQPGLGRGFLDEITRTFARIRENPLQFPKIGEQARRALLRRFPYAIYFRMADAQKTTVLAVVHQQRNPGAVKRRIRAERRPSGRR
ncbi:MAG: type II toxin-antitoxin system RelE/ParE family toxin [Polyangiaceae bacterium]